MLTLITGLIWLGGSPGSRVGNCDWEGCEIRRKAICISGSEAGGTPNGVLREDGLGGKSGMPLLKDNVRIYTGAIVVGGVTVGENSIINAGKIVTSDVAAVEAHGGVV